MDLNLSEPKIVNKKLLLGGYVYVKSRDVGGKSYWDCKLVRRGQCKARAITSMRGGTIYVEKGAGNSPHLHPSSPEACRAEIFKANLNSQMEDRPEATPAQLLRDELPKVDPGVLTRLPSRESLKTQMRRVRRKNMPANPTSLLDLHEIPDRFKETLTKEKFLFYDSNSDENYSHGGRILIFATRRNLELLARSEEWFLDGTFKVSPKIFTQVSYFTIIIILFRILHYLQFFKIFRFLRSSAQLQHQKTMKKMLSLHFRLFTRSYRRNRKFSMQAFCQQFSKQAKNTASLTCHHVE